MEQHHLATEFAQLRLPHNRHIDRLQRFRLSGLSRHNMDELVQDLNNALDETAGSTSSNRSAASRRKTWKRKCKSTSNLVMNFSDDSSSSVDNIGLLSRDRGTSSLQLSDSDLDISGTLVRSSRHRVSRLHDFKKKKGLSEPLTGALESDSFTENISPFKEFRVNSKRKRKFKRMNVDQSPENRAPTASGAIIRSPGQATKRKKVRSRSGCEPTGSRKAGIVPGKRKRSAREKSVESGELLDSLKNKPKKVGPEGEAMETEEVKSSSSLSSSEWEDGESDIGLIDGREADDEQSDWPGPEPGLSVMALTDEELDPDITFSALLAGPAPSGSQGTPCKALRGRGRDIRAGTRRLGGQVAPAPGYTIKSASSEHVSRFLQDPFMPCLRLTVLRSSDQSKILNLANLYSLTLTREGEHVLVLTKTGQTVKMNELAVPGEFAVPGLPTRPAFSDKTKKRQKRTPPPSPGPSNLRNSSSERHSSGSARRHKISGGAKSS